MRVKKETRERKRQVGNQDLSTRSGKKEKKVTKKQVTQFDDKSVKGIENIRESERKILIETKRKKQRGWKKSETYGRRGKGKEKEYRKKRDGKKILKNMKKGMRRKKEKKEKKEVNKKIPKVERI